MMNHFISIILLIGAAQGIILSSVLSTTNRGNKTANRILGITTGIFSVMIILFLIRPKDLDRICFTCLFFQVSFFLQAPLIYLYVCALTQKSFQPKPQMLWHALPFVLVVAAYCTGFLFFVPESLTGAGQLEVMFPFIMTVNLLISVHMLFYLFLSFKRLKIYTRELLDRRSDIEKINLVWLKLILTGASLIWLVPVFLFLFSGECGYETWGGICAVYSVLMYMMGYFGLKQPEIFSWESKIPRVESEKEITPKAKYKKSTLTRDDIRQYYEKLVSLMDEEKDYLDNNLTLSKLASKMSVSTHHLSQIINEMFKQNFYEFINSRRIEHAKIMLHDDAFLNQTISSIAYDCGFNSISAFNSAFKKFTKTTPSKYRSVKGH